MVAIHAQEGDVLQPGQLVMELDAAELSARRAEAAARLAELERGPRAEDIAAAKAEWESLQAQLEFARLEDQRAQELFASKTISSTERDQAGSRARALEKSVVAAEQRFAVLKAGTRAEQVDQARARLAEMDAQLLEMRIVAPGVGDAVPAAGSNSPPGTAAATPYVLETLPVKVGDVLMPDRTAATLLLADRPWVRVYVPEQWLAAIRVGQKVEGRTDAGAGFTGIIEQINRQAEFTPRNVQTAGDRIRQVFGVKIRVPAELRAGLGVEIAFPNVPPIPK